MIDENESLNSSPKGLEVEKSSNVKSVVITILSVFLIGSMILSYLIVGRLMDEVKSKHQTIIMEEADRSTCVYKRDSLAREVQRLSIYKTLTKSMVLRDEATSLLPHKVGDIAHCKNDSSQVVISDIIIGGSKYNYYVRYKVLHKDNTTEEVMPELIY